MFRYLAPPDCSDCVIQPTEQCIRKDANGRRLRRGLPHDGAPPLRRRLGERHADRQGRRQDRSLPALAAAVRHRRVDSLHSTRTARSAAATTSRSSLRAMTAELSPISAQEQPALAAGSNLSPEQCPALPARADGSSLRLSAAFLNGQFLRRLPGRRGHGDRPRHPPPLDGHGARRRPGSDPARHQRRPCGHRRCERRR